MIEAAFIILILYIKLVVIGCGAFVILGIAAHVWHDGLNRIANTLIRD